MSEVINTPTDVRPGAAPPALKPGNRGDIRLIGLYPDKRHYGKDKPLMAKAYTGFIKPNGKKEVESLRTGVTTEKEAKPIVETFLEDLRTRYDELTRANGQSPSAGTSPTAKPGEETTERLLLAVLDRWEKDPKRRGTIVGYKTDGKAFLRLSGELARRTPDKYTEPQCENIRDRRLAELNPATRAPNQCMRNLRYVLGEIPGFPPQLIDVFQPPRKQRGQGRKPDYGFGMSDRVAMWEGLSKATWAEQGLFFLGANAAMHLADATFTLTADLKEARDAVSRRERVKNGNPFKFTAWHETLAWFDRRERPDAVYVFWKFIFTPEELQADPDIILRELTPEEKAARLRTATSAARKCFNGFLERVKIKRPGISYRSFRHTDIAHFEANGVPRRVGMDVTGHADEQTYLDYIHSTPEQMASLSEITRECYDPARMGRRCFLTLTQVVEEQRKITEAGADRVIGAVTTHAGATSQASEQRIIAALIAHFDARFDELRQEMLAGGQPVARDVKLNGNGHGTILPPLPGPPSPPSFSRLNGATNGHVVPVMITTAAPVPAAGTD